MSSGGKSPVAGTMGFIADTNGGVQREQHIDPRRSSKLPGRINLKAVAEALAEAGMDPTLEIIKILRPGFDEEGKPLPSKLDPDVQARILNELLQYTQPKLKSIEVRAKGAVAVFDVNDEQARRIAEEFLRAGSPDGALPALPSADPMLA